MKTAGIDVDRVAAPRVRLTRLAIEQLALILENDPSVEGKCLRVLISGKGCHGFDYQVGFDGRRDDDLAVPLGELGVDLVMDPFSACYLGRCGIDYVRDPEADGEGFVVVNDDQEAHRGKFWRRDPSMLPPVR